MPIPPAPPENRLLGVGLRCCSATAFATMGVLMKVASGHGARVGELIFFRAFGALPVILIVVLAGGGRAAIRVRDPIAHLTRSLVGTTSMALTFGALVLLPLAQATTLTYSAPLFATILSALVLGETVGRRRWAAVVAGFVGVLLVADPFDASAGAFALAIGVAAALGQAAVMITLRQVSRSETTTSIVFWFSIFTSLAGLCLLPWSATAHRWPDYAAMVGGGLAAGVGQLTMTGSLRYAPVSVVTPFDYIQILWATLAGWLALGNPIGPAMLAGAGLICASGIYTALREARRGRIPAQALAVPEA